MLLGRPNTPGSLGSQRAADALAGSPAIQSSLALPSSITPANPSCALSQALHIILECSFSDLTERAPAANVKELSIEMNSLLGSDPSRGAQFYYTDPS